MSRRRTTAFCSPSLIQLWMVWHRLKMVPKAQVPRPGGHSQPALEGTSQTLANSFLSFSCFQSGPKLMCRKSNSFQSFAKLSEVSVSDFRNLYATAVGDNHSLPGMCWCIQYLPRGQLASDALFPRFSVVLCSFQVRCQQFGRAWGSNKVALTKN